MDVQVTLTKYADIAYMTKELARKLAEPTKEDEAKAKHLLKYISATNPKYLYSLD